MPLDASDAEPQRSEQGATPCVAEAVAELRLANERLRAELAERHRAETALRKLGRVLRTLNDANQLLLHSTDEAKLLRDVCALAVETAGYRMAWVGLVEHDEEKSLRPAAWAGEGADYHEHVRVSWGAGPAGGGPGGACVRESRPVVVRDIMSDPTFEPWREEARRRGYESVLAAPLIGSRQEVYGALGIYAEEPDAFDDEETALLMELAGDVGFGIEALRERQARADAEQRLREAARYARSLIEVNLNPLVTISPEGTITDVNKATEQATGLKRDQLIGTDFADYFTAPDEARAGYRKVLEEGVVRDYPLVLRSATGALMDVEYNAAVYRDEAGELQGVFAAARDVTESKKAQEQLAHLAAIVTSSADAIVTKDLDGVITSWNAAAERLYGYTAEEMVGRAAAVLAPPELKDEPRTLAARVLDGEEVGRYETRRLRKDGSIVDVELTMSPVLGAAGDIVAISVISHDVTERKQAEEASRVSSERLRLATRAARIGIWDWDVGRNRLFWDDSMYRLYGIRREDFGGAYEAWTSAIHPEDRERTEGEIEAALRGEREYAPEFRIVRPDGSVRFIKADSQTQRDSDGRPVRMLGTNVDITESREAEQALRESEEKYRTLIEKLQVAVVVHGADTAVLTANPKALELLGTTEDQLLGRQAIEPDWDFFREDGTALSLDEYPVNRVLASGEPLRNLVGGVNWCGERQAPDTWVLVNADPVFGAGGEIAQVIVTFADITERRLAEEERLARVRAAEALDGVNRAIAVAGDTEQMLRGVLQIVLRSLDCDRAWLFYPCDPDSPTFRVPMEVTKAESPGAGARGEDLPMPRDMAANLAEALASDDPVVYVAGTARPINEMSAEHFGVRSMMLTALHPKSDRPWAFGVHQCSHARIWTPTETRLLKEVGARLTDGLTSLSALQRLRESEASYRRMVDTAAEGIWILDPDGSTAFANARMADMLGTAVEAMVGRPLSDFCFAEDAEDLAAWLPDRSEGASVRHEHRLLRHDGSTVWTHVSAAPILDETGRPRGSMLMMTDITERKQAEQEILQLNAQLERRVEERTRDLEAANRELEAFGYSVSHDLRAPLRALDGFSLALLEDCDDSLDETARSHLGRIRAAAQHMGELIDAMLRLSRIGRQELHPADLDLSALARDIAAQLHSSEPERDVTFDIADGLVVHADPGLLSIVLSNLLSNAWKFTANHAAARIVVGRQELGDQTAYFVRDDGAGFDPAHADHLFEPFKRLHSDAAFPGMGIGLATVQRVIHRHGGRCWAEGAPDAGATFYFTLPA